MKKQKEDSFLLQNFVSQAARAFERTQDPNLEQHASGFPQPLHR